MTTDEMGCTTASAERIKTLVVGLQNIRMTCQAKVIIAAKTGDMIAVENNFGALRRKKRAALPQQRLLFPLLQLLLQILAERLQRNSGVGISDSWRRKKWKALHAAVHGKVFLRAQFLQDGCQVAGTGACHHALQGWQ